MMPDPRPTWPLWRIYPRTLFAVFLFGLALGWGSMRVEAAPFAQDAANGQLLFKQSCAACHTIGGGDLAGPDLVDVTTRRDPAWLERWLIEPDKMLAENDPLALELLRAYNNIPMPNMGLDVTQARDVLAYLAEPMEPSDPQPVVPAGPSDLLVDVGGDPQRGRRLFTGQILLANNGTSCISCHTVHQIGSLGGGTLGPDLTHAVVRYGEPGLTAALTGLPFPSMRGIFADHPLTPEEVEHLQAYLVQASASAPAQSPLSYTVVWLALVGALLLLGLSHLIWSNRQRGVRRQLLKK